MFVKNITLKNFRNYGKNTFYFSEGKNLICGNNGTGKTNIIEALSVLSHVKSFRKASDRNLIKFNERGYYISCTVDDNGEEYIYEIGFSLISKNRKKCRINENNIATFSEYYGNMLLIIAAPDDLFLVNGDPDRKRKFADSVISKYNSPYLDTLSGFRRVLKNRNHILKNSTVDNSELSVWDSMFSQLASSIVVMRNDFFRKFSRMVSYYYCGLSGQNLQISVEYSNNIKVLEKADIKTQLINNREKDYRFKTSTLGPHRDSYKIICDKKSFNDFASQGQKRLMALSFRLAERDIIEQVSLNRCILCFDDVFSELDSLRRNNLFKLIGEDNQVFFTVVDTELIDGSVIDISKVFDIDEIQV